MKFLTEALLVHWAARSGSFPICNRSFLRFETETCSLDML